MIRSFGRAVVLLAGSALGLTPELALSQKRDRDVITREEILASAQKDQDLYFLIRSLRPHFLAAPRGVRSLGGGAPAPTAVYINGNPAGELGRLRIIAAVTVAEVRYLDPSKAENEFGISHSGGAILVKLLSSAQLDRKPPPF
jgi:hypothetical protein